MISARVGHDEALGHVPGIDEIGPYRLFFYSSDGVEPPHVHVRRDRATAKFWLNPVRLAASRSFDDHELRDIFRIVSEHESRIMRVWNEHFDH